MAAAKFKNLRSNCHECWYFNMTVGLHTHELKNLWLFSGNTYRIILRLLNSRQQ